MRNILFVAPFPLETTMRFARAAAKLEDVRFLGIFQEEPKGRDRRIFDDVVSVKDGLDTKLLAKAVDHYRKKYGRPHRILGILEPLQVQLAELRAHFEIPGTDPRTADLFRDKARMKDALRAAGLPVARHRLLTGFESGQSFAREVGYPIVLKPPAGMGAKATFRVQDDESLRSALASMRVSDKSPMLAEEFLRGAEFSFETITIAGEPRFHSLSKYLPSCLEVLENPWIQWCCLLPRDISGSEWNEAKRIGHAAVKALGLDDGFTHMEWFRRQDGSLAIGEIAQRPPGANITLMTGLAHDMDPYRAWARSVVDRAFDGPYERKYAVGCAYLRGAGHGRVVRVENADPVNKKIGKYVEEAKLPTIGAPKSDSYEGDGFAVVRDRDTKTVEDVLRYIIENVRVVYA
ncbi:MAG: ATP-grasp domain-containing protein [Sandaracinus sp.]